MLVVIEGVDGCGKSSVAEALAEKLKCETLSFPNDQGYTGPMIRQYLRKEWEVWETDPNDGDMLFDKKDGALVFQALQIANRMEVMPRLQRASDLRALQTKVAARNLVCARYWQSGYVYGTFDGLDAQWLLDVHKPMVQADINILLDLPPEQAVQRRAARDGQLTPERYEGKLKFAEEIVQRYHDLWRLANSERFPGRWHIVDASQPLTCVIDTCWKAILRS